jgi:hypothetical protein
MLWQLAIVRYANLYDRTVSAIVRAPSEQEARALLRNDCLNENRQSLSTNADVWLRPEESTCVRLHGDGKDAVVHRNFRHG